MKENPFEPEKCLKEAEAFHGHLCAGIMLGTRMAILGMKAVEIQDPKGKDRKKLVVYVETDRCATDAILVVTGCQPGKRTMKILDYGKMAATFVNLETGKAVRVAAKNTDGDKIYTREMIEKEPHTVQYANKPDEELFTVTEVKVEIRPEDLPGPPLRTAPCALCGERVMDMKEVMIDGKVFCIPCAKKSAYYKPLSKS